MQTIDLLLHGVGHVGQAFLVLLERQGALLASRHDLTLRVVGAVDTQGGIWEPTGIAPDLLRATKRDHGTIAAAPGGEVGLTALACLARAERPLVVLESTLVELETGGPGLALLRAALAQGHSVVSANKGPLVLAFAELTALAAQHGVGLAYSATVCGGLPILNVGRYDLAHATILSLEGIVNSTTNYLLTALSVGRGWDEALRQAQADGIAEADPTLDVSGWDAANKLIILANHVLRQPTTKQDLRVRGITGITPDDLRAARQAGMVIKLVASATLAPSGRYDLIVEPRALPLDHPLARLDGHQMGLWLRTDINGELFLSIVEESPEPTAAAMLRDVILLVRGPRWG